MADGEWLTYTEAATQLGTTPDAIRQRIKRGQMQGSRRNDGRPQVFVSHRDGEQLSNSSSDSPNRPQFAMFQHLSALSGQIEAQKSHITTLQMQLTKAEAAAERERQERIAAEQRARDMTDQVAGLHADRHAAAEQHRQEIDRLQGELVEARRPWWRRWRARAR